MRLYRRMKKRLAKKKLRHKPLGWHNNEQLAKITALLKRVKVGDLYNDCDGFNHRLGKIIVYSSQFSRGTVVKALEYLKENGSEFCGCTQYLQEAWTADEVRKYYRDFTNDPDMQQWITPERRAKANGGHPICDEEGCKID